MNEHQLRPWLTLSTRDVFIVEPRVRVAIETVQLPDGTIIDDYFRIDLAEYVVVFAETVDGRVLFEKQYKHGLRRLGLMLPAGLLESGEDPISAAHRELREETGYVAQNWRCLGQYVVNGNYGCGKAHLFRAYNAEQVALPNSGDLEEMEIQLLSRAEIFTALQNGEIGLLSTVAMIGLVMTLLPMQP